MYISVRTVLNRIKKYSRPWQTCRHLLLQYLYCIHLLLEYIYISNWTNIVGTWLSMTPHTSWTTSHKIPLRLSEIHICLYIYMCSFNCIPSWNTISFAVNGIAFIRALQYKIKVIPKVCCCVIYLSRIWLFFIYIVNSNNPFREIGKGFLVLLGCKNTYIMEVCLAK